MSTGDLDTTSLGLGTQPTTVKSSGPGMQFDCVERVFRRSYAKYGRIVARYPVVFIILPVCLTIAMGGGFAFMEKEQDVEYLFTPEGSTARDDQTTLAGYFEGMEDNYTFERSLKMDLIIRVIATAKEGGSVWNDDAITELLALDEEIQTKKYDEIAHDDVCQKDGARCRPNGLRLLAGDRGILTYPTYMRVVVPGQDPQKLFLGYVLGGVSVDDVDDKIKDVKAVMLAYYIKDNDDGLKFADGVLKAIEEKQDNDKFDYIATERWHFYSIEQELAKNTERIIPFFSITFTVIINFAIVTAIVKDPVLSKPYLGMSGAISAGLSMVTAMGLLMYCGIKFVDIVAAAPFLALGIGVDDMFVMLAAWRKTDHYMGLEDRMSEAFSEAAMSITITSVTDVLAVAIGAITSFPSVRIFCTYTALMLFLDYFYQITFFAGCMALSGKREVENRHVWSCLVVPSKSEAIADGKDEMHVLCCTGGVNRENRNEEIDDTEMVVMKFFRDEFSKIINDWKGKVVVYLVFLLYLGVSIYGILQIEQGLQLKHLAPDDSYLNSFYDTDDKYFGKYSFQVQLVVNTPISSKEVVDDIEKMIKEFEDDEYFEGRKFTRSFLIDYLAYAKKESIPIDYDNLFGEYFKTFLSLPAYMDYQKDVFVADEVFRFILMSKIGAGTKQEMNLMKRAREIADSYDSLNAVVYSPRFIITEQYVGVLPNTLQNLGIAVGSMLVVSLIFIPSPVVSLWVAGSVVSICVGVVGFMSLWGVALDTVSMINLIMCIGFCVDFSAHITYAFVSSEKVSRPDRVQDALYTLGFPIIQGSFSTILAVVPLAFSFAYIFRTFFKVMFLVILFGTLQGLFVLPVTLAIVGPKGVHPHMVT